MSGIVIFSSNIENKYYEQSEAKGTSFYVLGEESEQWTSVALAHLKRCGVSAFFFPWTKIPGIRLQLETVRYPIFQVWREGELLQEVVGYKEDDLDKIINLYYNNSKKR